MSNYSIKIPDIGEGITEVELVEWFVNEGDRVHEDQQVASVMTEKVSVDITSPVSGTVATLGGKAGDVLAVGADLILIRLESEGSENAAASQSPSASQSQTTATESATEKSEVSQRITDSTPAYIKPSDVTVTFSPPEGDATRARGSGGQITVTISYPMSKKLFLPATFLGVNVFSTTYTTQATFAIQ